MRILLSAYACEPGKGSEPEVGWRWATGLARRGHDVWVITRANNQGPIERDPDGELANLHFVYYDLPAHWRMLKRWLGINFYYHAWQAGATGLAKRLHDQIRFDRAHHATFVVVRHPSFLRRVGVPYTFGPVAGGECIPPSMLAGLPLGPRLAETVRPLINRLCMLMPSVRQTLSAADRVVVTSPQTLALLPPAARRRATVRLAIATPSAPPAAPRRRHPGQALRALFVGQLHALKGTHLAIAAIQEARRLGADVTLTIVGDGPQRQWLQELAASGAAASHVSFVPWLPREQLAEIYAAHDVLLFPSLRDSGGMVVLEAMQAGLPVVCLALGGPGVIVGDDCGCAVSADGNAEAIGGLARALERFARDANAYESSSRGALKRALVFESNQLLKDLGY
jgi:glycosyltransferase involved in cell wall biosynthesis